MAVWAAWRSLLIAMAALFTAEVASLPRALHSEVGYVSVLVLSFAHPGRAQGLVHVKRHGVLEVGAHLHELPSAVPEP